jgi:heme-degrading monooxygenase HmoA
MPFISLTRLRIRSFRFMPFFAVYTLRALSQVKRAPGFQTGALLPDRSFAFWTMTAWDSQEHMRQYMITGNHKTAMPHLIQWCDEASVAHWTQDDTALPSWADADQRMRSIGRASKVRHPSPHHAALTYRDPRPTGGAPIHRVRREKS